jgi:putative hydrolase of the HAD superfamily
VAFRVCNRYRGPEDVVKQWGDTPAALRFDMATAIKALVLDFGGVLARPQSAAAIQGMATLAQLETEEFRRRYWHLRPEYDAGRLSGTAYWQHVIGDGIPNPDSRAETIEALKAADAESWMDFREDLWELAARFREQQGRTALLSNGVPDVMSRVRAARPLPDYFDVVVISYEVGCIKPEARIYELCLSALGVAAASALFVDDKRENLDAAEQLGLQVFHFTAESSVAELAKTIVPD